MAVEGKDVEMRIEENTDREEEDLDRSIGYEFAPEPKKMKLDSAPEIEPSPWDLDPLSDLEDPESDIYTEDPWPTSAAEADYNKYCKQRDFGEKYAYYFLDSVLPVHVLGCEDWNRPPLYDMQYKELHDAMKEKHLNEVVQQREAIFRWKTGSCSSIKIAKEIAMQHQYGDFGPLTEEEMFGCLTDLLREHVWSEELRLFKEYELFLLDRGYWIYYERYRKGDWTRNERYKTYDHYAPFDATHYSLKLVQEEFEKWIFKLRPEEAEEFEVARKHIDRDDRKRRRMFRFTTRAKYVTMKLKTAEEWGIISMDKLKSDFEKNKGRKPLPYVGEMK